MDKNNLKYLVAFILLIAVIILFFIFTKIDSLNDLKDFIHRAEKKLIQKGQQISDSRPKIEWLKVLTYQNKGLRSPFADPEDAISLVNANPLTSVPLNMLRFIGIMIQDGQTIAYVTSPTGGLFPLKVGDSIGDHQGKIIKIYPDHLEIAESTATDGRPGTQRIVSLQLKEESS